MNEIFLFKKSKITSHNKIPIFYAIIFFISLFFSKTASACWCTAWADPEFNNYEYGSTVNITWKALGTFTSGFSIRLAKGDDVIASVAGGGGGSTGTLTWTLPDSLLQGDDYNFLTIDWDGDIISLGSYFSVGPTMINARPRDSVYSSNDVQIGDSININYTSNISSPSLYVMALYQQNVMITEVDWIKPLRDLNYYKWVLPIALNSGENYHFRVYDLETGEYFIEDEYVNFSVIDSPPNIPNDAFVTTWKTTAINETITIPTAGSGYNYDVDWGDGNYSTGYTGNATHQYATAGIYQVAISGDFPRIYFNNTGDKEKILTIEKWGGSQWRSMEGAFYGCENLVSKAPDKPDLTNVSSTSRMFQNAISFNGDSYMNSWEMNAVTDMSYMFYEATVFNHDISDWNVGAVQDMREMFNSASTFNKNLGDWNVVSVINMEGMFHNADHFNQDIGDWNVSNVTNMNRMFQDVDVFNKDIGDWDVGSVVTMISMFQFASSFNQELYNWNVSQVENISYIFANASSFNTKLNNWRVSNVTNMSNVFANASAFNQDISDWNVSAVTDMSYMFHDASSYNSSLEDWNVGSVLSMRGMFLGAASFSGDISDWNMGGVLDTTDMFGVTAVAIATDNPAAVTASGVYGSSFSGWKAFDGLPNTMWLSSVWQTPAWIRYDFESLKRVTSYSIDYSNGSIRTRAPKDFTLEGSNNGSSWTVVDRRTNQTNWGGLERRTYSVNAPRSYSNYRLVVTDDNDIRSGIVVLSIGGVVFH